MRTLRAPFLYINAQPTNPIEYVVVLHFFFTQVHLTTTIQNRVSYFSEHLGEVTVEKSVLKVGPPNKGHYVANGFVPCREVVPILEVK